MKTLACAAIVTLSSWAAAQQANPRYELAWRLRELDREWAKHNTAQERAKALPRIEDAMQLWSSGDLRAATEAIDDARTTLDGELIVSTDPQDQVVDEYGLTANDRRASDARVKRDGMRRAITPAKRLCDKSELNVTLVSQSVYGAEDSLRRYCGLCDESLLNARERALHPSLPLSDVSEGDRFVPFHLTDPEFGELRRTIAVSIVSNCDARLAALEKAIAALPQRAPALEVETAKASLALLKSLTTGAPNTSDVPAARLLAETEQVVAAAATGDAWYATQRTGDFSIVMPLYKARSVHVRVLVPTKPAPRKLRPLVLALHGEVGDENSLLDRCDGALARECEQRGWLLAAPRLERDQNAAISMLLVTLNETWPFDYTRVFLLGHSSGALAGMRAFEQAPAWFNGFAAIGGGRGTNADTLVNRNVFCAAGERDFGRFGVERLHQTLSAAGSQTATLKIYPNCEHLMVLVDALPDVFTWFDKLAE